MISKNEHEILGFYNTEGVEVGLITANETETMYFFYEPTGKDYKKLGKATSPLKLEIQFNTNARMGIKL